MMSATLSSRSLTEALGSNAGGRSERAVVMLVSMMGADGDGDRGEGIVAMKCGDVGGVPKDADQAARAR